MLGGPEPVIGMTIPDSVYFVKFAPRSIKRAHAELTTCFLFFRSQPS
jgi:hypothetical protein